MKRHAIIAACAVLALASAPGMAGAQAPAQGTSSTAGASQPATPSSTATAQSTPTPGARQRTDALAALQDARVTLARLTEASLSQDARGALARVSTDFRALYRAYTGEEPTPEKTALQASKPPDPNWEKSYDAVSAAVNNVIGPAANRSAAVGTSGANAPAAGAATAAGGRYELTTPVRQDFEVLRQQLQRFHTAAAGRSTTPGDVK